MSAKVVKEKTVAVAAKDVEVLVERAESEDGDPAVSVTTLTLRRTNFAIKYFFLLHATLSSTRRIMPINDSDYGRSGSSSRGVTNYAVTSIESVSRGSTSGDFTMSKPAQSRA